ncbi:nuclear fragile X mental retardation-interacting protein 2-like isoform X2 [Megalops cyprinoides]|uniref:nuclear fragile X mental retardation-interacting protein 2-like isoform X2 n=1 Tax=Megalops cyprinoides TaxID=118141 RepID=UPI001864666E|nr:nuclear fragile X mental retardation-interacting protein 2-like isoform X2 [Megalops cyprinoides]
MEDRPREQAGEKRYHHEEEKSPSRPKSSLKNDQSQCQYQHQETQTKKTGNGKINGSTAEGEKVLSSNDLACVHHPTNGNGGRPLLDTNIKLKQPGKALSALSSRGRGSYHYKNSMDSKNDKPSDFSPHKGKPLDKKESVSHLNGVVSLSSGYIANGYPGKPAADNDGSGSESGYATPKKRKARSSSIKGAENVSGPQEKAMQQGSAAPPQQDRDPSNPDPTEKAVSSRLDDSRLAARADACAGAGWAGEPQSKNHDGKATGSSGKKFEDKPGKAKSVATVTAKEDSWTLFKPPPVFPVDNSSAKIVPKISYASKVKENLNKAAQVGGEALPSQEPGRPSLVPMSALKTITSASFTNGPVSGEGNGCLSAGPLLTTAASTVLLACPLPGGENVASSHNDSSITTTPVAATGETRKPSLFVYPLTPCNMQPALPSARQVDPPPAPTNQKALGDIFQNQWGLSFINEPNAGPEGGAGPSPGEGRAAEATVQGEGPPAGAPQVSDASPPVREHPPFPAAYEADKRTSPLAVSSVLKACPAVASAGGGGTQAQLPGQDTAKGEAGGLGAIVFASSKDPGADPPQASQANPVLALVKEQSPSKGYDRRCSWGSFDLKAAVIYHTKEIEYILNLQKQDPKRVVIYDETRDGPNQ